MRRISNPLRLPPSYVESSLRILLSCLWKTLPSVQAFSRIRRNFGIRLWTPSQSPVKVHATKLCLTIFAFYSLCQGVFRLDLASICKDRSEGKKEGTLVSKSA